MEKSDSTSSNQSHTQQQVPQLNAKQIQKYLEERKKRFPKRQLVQQQINEQQANQLLGVLQNDISNQPLIKYEISMNKKTKQASLIKQTPSVLDYFLRESQHKENSLIMEALQFIKDQHFLQSENIPTEFLYDFTTVKEVVSALPETQKDDYSYTYSYDYIYSYSE